MNPLLTPPPEWYNRYDCIIFFVPTKVYGYPGLETVVWYIIFSLIKSLKNLKTHITFT